MKPNRTPIDRAQHCVSCLRGIEDLLCAAGNSQLDMVNADKLTALLGYINEDLRDALDDLAQQGRKPTLRTV